MVARSTTSPEPLLLTAAQAGKSLAISPRKLWSLTAGRVADFHATRHTFITHVVAGGASVKVAQELARHSTCRLTLDRYSHTRLHDLQGALDSLPKLDGQPGAGGEELRATGTDDLAGGPPESAQHDAQQSGRETVLFGANSCLHDALTLADGIRPTLRK
jgi:hypothetical protein